MNKVLLLFDNKENSQMLAQSLSNYYEVVLPQDSPPSNLDTFTPSPKFGVFNKYFDVCIIDGRALNRLWETAQARKAAEKPPLILPFLLLTPRQDVGLVTRHLWKTIDDLILAPMEREELQARLEIMLRARNLSLELRATIKKLENEVAERQRVVEALAASEAKYRSLIHNSLDNIAVIQSDGTIQYENPSIQQILGFTPAELEERNVFEFVHPEDVEKTKALFQQDADNADGSIVLEYRMQHKDGFWRYFESRSNLSNADEDGIVVNSRDITERKQAEAEILKAMQKERELNELKSRFVSMISHEFRTPLSTINLCSELIEKFGSQLTPEKMSDYLHRIKGATEQMVNLLDNVLVIGRNEAGKLEFKPAALNLESFCHELVEEIKLSAGNQHEFNTVIPGKPTTACMDESLIRLILTNLLSNAIKYSSGGTIEFQLILKDAEASFIIRDEGIGIPPEEMSHLFESFHRAHNVGKIPGTGLGLTIVKNAVDLHGGTIAVDSEVGVGTTFTVTLPLQPQQVDM